MLRNLRFSLASLLISVFAVAFACAALRSASQLWASAAFTVCLSILLVGMLAAVFLRNGGQTFSAGFSIFTLAYLVLVFGPWFSGHVKDHLLTSRLLRYGYQQLTPADTSLGIALDDWDDDGLADLYFADDARLNNMYRNLGDGRFVDVSESFDMGTNLADFDDDGDLDLYVTNFELTAGRSWRNFERIGHSLFALLIGLVGGVLARSMRRAVYGTSRQPRRD